MDEYKYSIYMNESIKPHMTNIIIEGNNFNYSYIPTHISQLRYINNNFKQYKNAYYLPYSIIELSYTDGNNLNIDKLPPSILKLLISSFTNINNLPPFIQAIMLLVGSLFTNYNNFPISLKYLWIYVPFYKHLKNNINKIFTNYNNITHLALFDHAHILIPNINAFPNLISLYLDKAEYLKDNINIIIKYNKLENIIINPEEFYNKDVHSNMNLLNNCKSLKKIIIIITRYEMEGDHELHPYFTNIFKPLLYCTLNFIDNISIYQHFTDNIKLYKN